MKYPTFTEYTVHNIKVLHYNNNSNVVDFRIWVGVGSADENVPTDYGTMHFIEHMFFKGTTNRSYNQINCDFAKIGAQENAFTGTNDTCYYFRSENSVWEKGVEVLADMFYNSTFPKAEIEKERRVILEEYKMYQDDPGSMLSDNKAHHLFGEAGHSIIGTPESIQLIDKDTMLAYQSRCYTQDKIVVSVVGKVSVTKLLKTIEKYFAPLLAQSDVKHLTNVFNYSDLVLRKAGLEQSMIDISLRGDNLSSKNLADKMISKMLGSGMTSLLFQKIREELGLAYRVGTYMPVINNDVVLSIVANISHDKIQVTKDAIYELLNRIGKEGFTQEMFEMYKTLSRSVFAMTYEGSSGFNKSEGYMYLRGWKNYYCDFMERLDQLTLDQVNQRAEYLFKQQRQVSILTEEK